MGLRGRGVAGHAGTDWLLGRPLRPFLAGETGRGRSEGHASASLQPSTPAEGRGHKATPLVKNGVGGAGVGSPPPAAQHRLPAHHLDWEAWPYLAVYDGEPSAPPLSSKLPERGGASAGHTHISLLAQTPSLRATRLIWDSHYAPRPPLGYNGKK